MKTKNGLSVVLAGTNLDPKVRKGHQILGWLQLPSGEWVGRNWDQNGIYQTHDPYYKGDFDLTNLGTENVS